MYENDSLMIQYLCGTENQKRMASSYFVTILTKKSNSFRELVFKTTKEIKQKLKTFFPSKSKIKSKGN